MTSIIKSPTPRRELDALDKRIYELERRINRKQTDLKQDDQFVYANTVVTEQSFGQASAVGSKDSVARGSHTHGTPADPIPGHVGGADPHTQYVTSVTATTPLSSTGGRTPAISATTGQVANTLAVGNDSRFPTANEKAAMVPTQGTSPTGTNPFVVGDDPRMTNSRTPTAHGSTHVSNGTDAVPAATTSVGGLMAATDKSKLDGIGSGANVSSVNTRTGAVTGLAEDNAVVKLTGTQTVGGDKTFSGQTTMTGGPNTLRLSPSSVAPKIQWNEGGAVANNRLWDIVAASEAWRFRLINDADNAATDVIRVERTAQTVDSITLGGPTTVGDASASYAKVYAAGVELRRLSSTPKFIMEAAAVGSDEGLVVRTDTGVTPAVYFAVKNGSAFWSIGQSATGKRVSAGVTGTGAAGNAHQINFYWSDSGTIAKIETTESASTRRLSLDSGYITSGEIGAFLQLVSGTNATRHVLMDGALVQMSGSTRDNNFETMVVGKGGAALNTGAFRAFKAIKAKETGDTVAGFSAEVPGWAGCNIVANSFYGDALAVYNYSISSHCPIHASAFTVSSSRKTKFDIRPMDAQSCLANIKKLKPVRFKRPPVTPSERRKSPNVALYEDSDFAGLIAEEVGAIFPEAVSYGADMQPDGIDYAVITAHNTAAIQALLSRLEMLETRVSSLIGRR